MIKRSLFVVIFAMIFVLPGFTQQKKRVIYKQIDTTSLYMDIIYPDNLDKGKTYPAIVFYFGGGWNKGTTGQFEPHAKHLAGRGMVCFLVDYRVRGKHNTTPFECLKDAKSAFRFIRVHAAEYNIDPTKIIASGGSAGGHLAAATAFIKGYNEDSDDLSVSCVPNGLILFNPVIDNGPGGYGYDRIGDKYKDFSPIHNIEKGAPPTIFMVGTEDKLIPVETAKYFKMVIEKVGGRCDLMLYEGQPHGFFNYGNPAGYYEKTLLEADKFLVSLGYIK